VGIATQDPELRKRFKGQPEHVVNFFFFVAEELREIMASLGVRSMDELIGRSDLLEMDGAIEHWKARGVDLSQILARPQLPEGAPLHRTHGQEPVLDDALDWELLEQAKAAVEDGELVELDIPIRNVNRCVGGILSSHIAARHGADGLAEDAIKVSFTGSAGQSFGGWLAPGVSFTLRGDANDYCGKGLSGGTISVSPRDEAGFAAEDNVVVGNVALYGATAGKAFFRGIAGERFGVRNSGAEAVVEEVGDHGCEYMTGGRVVVLGPTGRNFAAGMSGGLAFVLDADGTFRAKVNPALWKDLMGMDEADAIEVRDLIAEHVALTGSPVGRRVLDDWENTAPKFVKVFPEDYRNVLEQLAEEEAAAAEQQPVSTGGEGFLAQEGVPLDG
jgi:glutamate synthase (NADPH/NADH) large chain/glutamate synthase (ferredoxin)